MLETCSSLDRFIFSGGGLILSYIVERYHGIAVFNPVVNGMDIISLLDIILIIIVLLGI